MRAEVISLIGAATSQGAAAAKTIAAESVLDIQPIDGLFMSWGDLLLTSSAAVGIVAGVIGIWRNLQ